MWRRARTDADKWKSECHRRVITIVILWISYLWVIITFGAAIGWCVCPTILSSRFIISLERFRECSRCLAARILCPLSWTRKRVPKKLLMRFRGLHSGPCHSRHSRIWTFFCLIYFLLCPSMSQHRSLSYLKF